MLREVRPRSGVDLARGGDHGEAARRDRGEQRRLGGARDLRAVVIDLARVREVERVLERRALVGLEIEALGRGRDGAGDRDRAGRDLVQRADALGAAGRVGDDDLARVHDAGEQLAGDVLLDLLGAVPVPAIVGAEVALADQDLIERRAGDRGQLDDGGEGVAAGGDDGAGAARGDRVRAGHERQLDDRERARK